MFFVTIKSQVKLKIDYRHLWLDNTRSTLRRKEKSDTWNENVGHKNPQFTKQDYLKVSISW